MTKEQLDALRGHTPGPWGIVYDAEGMINSIRVQEWGKSNLMSDYRGCIVADFARAHGGRNHAFAEAESNATLIAAAPDLLAHIDEQQEVIARMSGQIAVALSTINKQQVEIDKLRQHVEALEDAARAYQELNVCYRMTKRPPDKLFKRLDKANKALDAYRAVSEEDK